MSSLWVAQTIAIVCSLITPETHIAKIQRVQNCAAQLVCGTSKFDHITPNLICLHWPRSSLFYN